MVLCFGEFGPDEFRIAEISPDIVSYHRTGGRAQRHDDGQMDDAITHSHPDHDILPDRKYQRAGRYRGYQIKYYIDLCLAVAAHDFDAEIIDIVLENADDNHPGDDNSGRDGYRDKAITGFARRICYFGSNKILFGVMQFWFGQFVPPIAVKSSGKL